MFSHAFLRFSNISSKISQPLPAMTVSWPAVRRYTAPAFGVSAVSIFLQPPWQGEEWRELAESKLGVIII
jgi:hypothetical protein